MGKNVGAVAAQAVQKSEKVKTAERTPEQIILSVRHLLAARLSVTPDDQRFLLAAYDELLVVLDIAIKNDILKTAQIAELEAKLDEAFSANIDLTRKNEEFRSVYEQENRTASLRVDVIEIGPGECGTLMEPDENDIPF